MVQPFHLFIPSLMGLATQTYDIITRLAVGNGSLVYRAVEKSTLRQVALKLLTQDDELDHRLDVPALLAAAPRIKQITGSHVCQLLEAFEDEDGPVLVYEFANGLNGVELPQKRKLSAAEALDIAAQITSALRSGERQRTPHCDLKPSNLVFVDMPDGRPFTLVLDWGLAAFRTGFTEDSLSYTAPERLSGGAPSHRADLFSAGAVLFYLLTGKLLAGGNSSEEVLASWAKARPEILAELRPDLSPKLVQWICSLLSLDPAKRAASAVDAGTALATLNPPPPLIAPESIRPRSGSARSISQSGKSGVAPAPRSGVVRPPASSVQPAPGNTPVPVPKLAPTPVPSPQASPGKSSVMILALLFTLCTGAAGGVAWWFTVRRESRKSAAAAAVTEAMRTPAPSVTKPAPKPESRPVSQKGTAALAAAKADNVPKKKPPAPKPTAAKPPTSAGSIKKVSSDADVFVATERFAYAEGDNLLTKSTGSGWGGSWQGDEALVRKASLTHTVHPASGGELVLPESSCKLSRRIGGVDRVLRDPAKGGHFYFGLLVHHSDGTPAPGGLLRVNPLDPTDPQHPIQIVVADTGPGLRISFADLKAPIEFPDASQSIFLLCRIKLTKTKADLWDMDAWLLVNPDVKADAFDKGGKPIQTNVKGIRLPKEFGILIQKQGAKTSTIIDEIRLGRHWEEMTFKPPQIDPPPAPQVKAAAR